MRDFFHFLLLIIKNCVQRVSLNEELHFFLFKFNLVFFFEIIWILLDDELSSKSFNFQFRLVLSLSGTRFALFLLTNLLIAPNYYKESLQSTA